MEISRIIENKKVLYIATKDTEYIRTVQIRNIVESSNVSDFTFIGSKHNYILLRLIDIRIQLAAIDVKKYDIVLISFLPQLIIKYIYRKTKDTNILIMSDFFLSLFDTIVDDRKILSVKNPISKFLYNLDKYTLECSDYIYTDTKSDLDYFISEFKADVSNADVLYLEADKSIYDHPVKEKRKSGEMIYKVLYFGTGLPLQGIDHIFEAIEILNKNEEYLSDSYSFAVIGNIGKRNAEIAKKYPNVKIYSWIPQDELADMIRDSDLCLAGHFANDIGKAHRTIPGKAYIYEQMNKDMILGDSIANHELFTEDERHHFVQMGSGKALADSIHKQYKYWSDRK